MAALVDALGEHDTLRSLSMRRAVRAVEVRASELRNGD
jgi:hypothetical protein